jgi:ribosomal protein L11 methyltransferase
MLEVIIALLGEMPFDTFEENETGVNAYIKEQDFSAEIEVELNELSESLAFSFEKEKIAAQNWNEVWEASFEPIIIEDFCGIRADFHAPLQLVKHEIVITPKMSFGTGHHETTYQMIKTMRDIDFINKRVFDYGCGTGILAILAGKLGAKEIIGVDNEYPAYESTLENAASNGVPYIKSIFGTLNNVAETNFDIILANINRNIIVNSLDVLYDKLNLGGYILMSGFLEEDEAFMRNTIEMKGLRHLSSAQRGNWICMKAEKV